ncbi:MAG: response regulator [Burkholderiales bacterium]|nr:response regulator [Burkholderiales bacterium]
MERLSITTAQAAKRLGVSAQTVQKWVDAGYLPAWKTVGGHRRLDAEAVERMAVERRSGDSPVRGVSIMLVEDDPVTAAVLEEQLLAMRADAEVRIFEDGFSALLDAGRDVPNVLVTDIDLPGLDGLAMVSQLRQNPATQKMQIVLVTHHTRAELARFGPVPEGVTLLHKPVPAEVLAGALGWTVQERAPDAAAAAPAPERS